MRFRLLMSILLIAVALMAGGLWVDRGYSLQGQVAEVRQQKPPNRQAERRQRAAHTTPAGRSLQFDVSPKDHRVTSRYILEITDSAGKVTTHDVKKPRRRGGSIAVPLPDLPTGNYKMVVVAEGSGGKSRSVPLDFTIPPR